MERIRSLFSHISFPRFQKPDIFSCVEENDSDFKIYLQNEIVFALVEYIAECSDGRAPADGEEVVVIPAGGRVDETAFRGLATAKQNLKVFKLSR